MSASPARITVDSRKIDELDAAICTLARELDRGTYRLLELIREFDDRFGFAKWGHKSCAEWLQWRCQISLSAAREKVRTAQALRRLPKLSAALAAGKISYTKVRALTRVATAQDEALLLAFARKATAQDVEERVRQMRNTAPESAEQARRAWEHWAKKGESNPENLTLACCYHHVLLHEGGFSIRKLDDGTLEFLRPDGRVIPRSGYLPEDIVDDYDDVKCGGDPSAEGCCGPGEVREAAPVYRVHRATPRPALTQNR
jgi:hypothetical protein